MNSISWTFQFILILYVHNSHPKSSFTNNQLCNCYCLNNFDLCVNHVIWTGRRILKLASNVEMFIYYFVYSLIKKKDESLCNFHNEITQPFLNLEGAPNVFHCNIKKPQQKNHSIFNTNFNILHNVQITNDMIHI